MAKKEQTNLVQETRIAVFRGREVRKTIHNDEWWFSVADVVEVLTDTADVRQYVKKMRQRDPELSANWGTICTPLQILAPDGKMRETNCANTEGIFRIIQSIPSPKAEPFKRWLAKVGYERIQEIEDPELATGYPTACCGLIAGREGFGTPQLAVG
jgi:DNA-damage-inducible protein D